MNKYRIIHSDKTTKVVEADNLQSAKRSTNKRITSIYKVGYKKDYIERGLDILTR